MPRKPYKSEVRDQYVGMRVTTKEKRALLKRCRKNERVSDLIRRLVLNRSIE
jgi:hypothetical protein